MSSESDLAQAYLKKKFEGYIAIPESTLEKNILIPKKNIKTIVNYLSDELKSIKLSKSPSEEQNHRTRVSATRLILRLMEFSTENEISAIATKANVRLSDDEAHFERAVIACRGYMTACKASPEVMLAELKAELAGE